MRTILIVIGILFLAFPCAAEGPPAAQEGTARGILFDGTHRGEPFSSWPAENSPDVCSGDWQHRIPFWQCQWFLDVAWGAGTWVAIGDTGTIYSSEDGITWTRPEPVHEDIEFKDLVYAGRQFMAVGYNRYWSATMVARSADGATWETVSVPGVMLTRLAYAFGRYYASSEADDFMYSTDGRSWTPSNSGPCYGVIGMAACAGRLLAWTAYSDIYVTEDGEHWVKGGVGLSFPVHEISTDGDRFLLSYYQVWESPDGVSWRPLPCSIPDMPGIIRVRYNGTMYLGWGMGGPLYRSPDAAEWTRMDVPPCLPNEAVWSGSEWVLVGGGNGPQILVSPDAITWENPTRDAGLELFALAYGAPGFAAVGRVDNEDCVYRSPDGRTWEREVPLSPAGGAGGMAYGAGRFVKVAGHLIDSSEDGLNWTERVADDGLWLKNVLFANGRFVAVGYGDALYLSGDGLSWERVPLQKECYLSGVTWGRNEYVAVGDFGLALASPDGRTWQVVLDDLPFNFRAIAYGDSQYVATAVLGSGESMIVTSMDARRWVGKIWDDAAHVDRMVFGSHHFMAVGGNRTLLSRDTYDWWIWSPDTGSCSFNDVAFGNGQFLTVGKPGLIWAHECAYDLEPPQVTDIRKVGSPFRIMVYGTNLQPGMRVYIGSQEWTDIKWKEDGRLVLKKGKPLKKLCPRGEVVRIRFVNPDGGVASRLWWY